MSADDAFDHVPPHITEYRYEDAFFGVKKKQNKIDVYTKNIQSEYRLHLYIKGSEHGAVITKEPTTEMPKGHGKPFVLEDFLRVFVKPMEELLGNVERVELTDHRFADKHVQMATIHKFRFIQTRKGMAYFEPDIEYRESKFEHIDRSLSQVGAVKGWFGRDIAMVFVGRGEVHILSMKQIQRCAKLLGRELRKFGFDNLYPL